MRLIAYLLALAAVLGGTGFLARYTSSPAAIPNLSIAWDPTSGVTTGANGITSIAGAWGTSIAGTGTGTTAPDQTVANGPSAQNMVQFTVSRGEFFSFSAQTYSAFTTCVAADPADLSSQRVLWSRSTGNTFIQLDGQGNRIQMHSTGGSGTVLVPLGTSPLVGSFQTYCLSYDSATNTATPWYDCIMGTPVVDAGFSNLSFTFDQFAKGGTAGFNGYALPAMLYSRVLNDSETQTVCRYIASTWKPTALYVSTSGDDTSNTPWRQATPWQSIQTAIGNAFPGQTVCPKDTDTFRQGSTRIQISPTGNLARAGTSAQSGRIGLDGACWLLGGQARIRFSSAPTLASVGGGVYTAGTTTMAPADDCGGAYQGPYGCGYVYYVPGGTPTIGAQSAGYSTNVVRLPHTTGTQTAPACNQWGRSPSATLGASGTIYVKVCSAGTPLTLTTGDIEVPTPTGIGTLASAVVASGGAGTYLVNDVLTVVVNASYCPTAPTVTVTAVAGGLPTTVSVTNPGVCYPSSATFPSSPAATTGGGGTGATLTLTESVSPDMVTPFLIAQPYWTVQNLTVEFAEDRGPVIKDAAHINVSNVTAQFNGSDGFGCDETSIFGVATDLNFYNAKTFYNGRALAGGSGNNTGYGDGVSAHNSCAWTFYDLVAAWNDKSGTNSVGASQNTFYRPYVIGNTTPYSYRAGTAAQATGTGNFTVVNGIGINECTDPVVCNQDGAALTVGVGKLAATMTLEFTTLYSTQTAGNGIDQLSSTDATMLLRDNIVSGFAVGLKVVNSGTVTADHNQYRGNTANYSGISAGTGDSTANPQFTSAPLNLVPLAPVTGIAITGVTDDFNGKARPPQSVGAYSRP